MPRSKHQARQGYHPHCSINVSPRLRFFPFVCRVLPVIHFKQVHKSYPAQAHAGLTGRHEALAGVSFDIEAGELVLLCGHSGAGKTTLLKLLAALERPSAGTVMVQGHDIGA